MSENLLRLIPDVPQYVPPENAVSIAISILSDLTANARVDAQIYPEVRFVDQGGNFEAIYCPCCGAELDPGWWGQLMDQAAQNHFTDLSMITPCCACDTNLNDLRYHWPAGFARFCITIGNPPPKLRQSTIRMLNKVLGTRLRQVWVHR